MMMINHWDSLNQERVNEPNIHLFKNQLDQIRHKQVDFLLTVGLCLFDCWHTIAKYRYNQWPLCGLG